MDSERVAQEVAADLIRGTSTAASGACATTNCQMAGAVDITRMAVGEGAGVRNSAASAEMRRNGQVADALAGIAMAFDQLRPTQRGAAAGAFRGREAVEGERAIRLIADDEDGSE